MPLEKNEEKLQAALAAAAAVKRKGGLGRGLNALIEGSYDKKGDRPGSSERLVSHPVNSVGFISVEHILLAAIDDSKALRDLGVDRDRLMQALRDSGGLGGKPNAKSKSSKTAASQKSPARSRKAG